MNTETPNVAEYLENLRRSLGRADAVPVPVPGTEKKAAAVLMPLVRRNGDLHLVYTRRSDRLASHRGQVAFPGGRFDRQDPHLLAAALREAYEEVGLEPQSVEVLGSFAASRTRSTGIMVTPFVGMVRGSPELRADPKEVAEIFEVPLTALRDTRYRGHYKWRDNGYWTRRPAIIYGGQTIWGLTYSLTLTFLQLGGFQST
jgi:8-oxo-dGTP pyrophosphatase MutT (NUDIX family)